jgi:hypothetical protein
MTAKRQTLLCGKRQGMNTFTKTDEHMAWFTEVVYTFRKTDVHMFMLHLNLAGQPK